MPRCRGEDEAGTRAHAARRRLRRDRLRRELCRPRRRPRAGRRAHGRPARVLLLDRYEIGERQTSACAAPTAWLDALGLERSIRQTFSELVIHTPHTTVRYPCRGVLHLRLPRALRAARRRRTTPSSRPRRSRDRLGASRRARSRSRPTAARCRAPLVVDALGWRRVLDADGYQPPDAPLSRGLEVHPRQGGDLEIWIERSIVPAGYGWSFPARRRGARRRRLVRPALSRQAADLELAERLDRDAVRYQGNWIPHKLRAAADGGVFFAGDSAGHCLPLTAEGIRTAFYFGIACGRELRARARGRATRETALRRYAALLGAPRVAVPLDAARAAPRAARAAAAAQRSRLRGMASKRFRTGRSSTTSTSPTRASRAAERQRYPRRSRSGRLAYRRFAFGRCLSGNPPSRPSGDTKGVLSNEHHRQDHRPCEEGRRRPDRRRC